jgi:hypothetical protein
LQHFKGVLSIVLIYREELAKISTLPQNLSLEDYVIALKDLVGLEALIHVVGIGKEDDISNLTADALLKISEDDLASQNGSNESNYVGAMYLDKGNTSEVSSE